MNWHRDGCEGNVAQWNYNSFPDMNRNESEWPLANITEARQQWRKDMSEKRKWFRVGRGDGGWPLFALAYVVYRARLALSDEAYVFIKKKSKHAAVWLWIPARWTNTWPEHCHSDVACAASLLIKHKCINSKALWGDMEICIICYCVFWDLNMRLLNFTHSVSHI